MPEQEYLTTAEVAARYRCEQSTVRYWRHIGYGPKGKKVGRRVLYPRSEIEKFDREICGKPAAAGVA
jgi:DNA-binding transcriptional MerR regulator